MFNLLATVAATAAAAVAAAAAAAAAAATAAPKADGDGNMKINLALRRGFFCSQFSAHLFARVLHLVVSKPCKPP